MDKSRQQRDGTYAYTKSASFNRLVYNNWAPPVFEDKILTIASKADSSRRAVLISEINLDSKHLKSDKSYKLSLKNLYSCAKQGEESSPCHLKTMVRCYGKVKDGSWGVTHESIRATKAKFADNGVFKQVQTIKAKDCKNGIHLSLEGSAIPNLASYGFRGMKVALQEL